MFAAALGALAVVAPATASQTQESIIQDDPLLLSATTQAEVDQAFTRFRAAGADRVRVSVFWFLVASASSEQQRPAGDPYPAPAWAAYDRIVRSAARADMPLLFSVAGPGPAWATPGNRCEDHPGRGCGEGTFRPDPREFARFVKAAGRRYSGERLPRVSTWSVWNEPNYPSSLKPVWEDNSPASEEDMVPAAPRHYRELVDAAWSGLQASGPSRDRVLIGETAPRGGKNPRKLGNAMMPSEFVRELYCVDERHAPWTGAAARERGCPETAGERSAFRSEHPGLFRSQGWAHHPYSLARGRWRLPTWRHELADNVAIGNLSHLTRTLDRAAAAWDGGVRKSIWITEYGYQTTPPDPIAGVPPARHGPLYAWGEQLAYGDPRVASFAQFLLFDDKPIEGFSEADPRRWVTWQSGLFDAGRRAKPFDRDYRLPLRLYRRGSSLRVFAGFRAAPPASGALRGAAPGLPLDAVVQHAPDGGAWRSVREVAVRNPRGYLEADLGRLEPGRLRIVWLDPGSHRLVVTRTARVR